MALSRSLNAKRLLTELLNALADIPALVLQSLNVPVALFNVILARVAYILCHVHVLLHNDELLFQSRVADALVEVIVEVCLLVLVMIRLAAVFANATSNAFKGQSEQDVGDDDGEDDPNVERVKSKLPILSLKLHLGWVCGACNVDAGRQNRCQSKHDQEAEQMEQNDVLEEVQSRRCHVVVKLYRFLVAA